MTSAVANDGKTFVTSCVNADGDDINAMKRSAIDISRETFIKHCSKASRQTIEAELGYDKDFPIKKDWHVSYHKSTYQGRPCVYLVWSAIEYVFA